MTFFPPDKLYMHLLSIFQWQYKPDKEVIPVVIQCVVEDEGMFMHSDTGHGWVLFIMSALSAGLMPWKMCVTIVFSGAWWPLAHDVCHCWEGLGWWLLHQNLETETDGGRTLLPPAGDIWHREQDHRKSQGWWLHLSWCHMLKWFWGQGFITASLIL